MGKPACQGAEDTIECSGHFISHSSQWLKLGGGKLITVTFWKANFHLDKERTEWVG
jgi:hypothetical protein